MGEWEERKNALEEIRKKLNEINQIKPESLVRADQLGQELSFEEARPVLEQILSIYRQLEKLSLEAASPTIISQVLGGLNTILNIFKQIREFSPKHVQANPIQARDAIISKILSFYNSLWMQITPFMAYLKSQRVGPDDIDNQLQAKIKSFDTKINEIFEAQQLKLAESEKLLESMRSAAGTIGVSRHSLLFEKQAGNDLKEGKPWLYWTIGLGAAIAIFGTFIWLQAVYFPPKVTDSNLMLYEIIQISIGRLAVLSILYFGIVLTGRMYRASRHNFTVNKHRQNALSTFETFANSASDDQAKNAVLNQATQCIFSQQTTGYLGDEGEQKGSAQLMQIIREVIPKSGAH